jgi:hypothetical protein
VPVIRAGLQTAFAHFSAYSIDVEGKVIPSSAISSVDWGHRLPQPADVSNTALQKNSTKTENTVKTVSSSSELGLVSWRHSRRWRGLLQVELQRLARKTPLALD